MKKLIAIFAVSTLMVGTAFAQAQVSGLVEGRLYVVDAIFDDNDTNDQIRGDIGAAYIQLAGQNPDGTLGGLFRLRNTDIVRTAQWFHRVFVWWRPVEQFRMFLGIDNDGLFDTASIVGWDFHEGDNDYLFNHHWDFWREVFPGNWDGFGIAFSFWPVEGLNLNLTVPVGGMNWPQSTASQVRLGRNLADVWKGLRLQGSYAISDVGIIQFAYNLGDKDGTGDKHYAFDDSHFGRLGVSFLLNSIDSINILVGGSVLFLDSADGINPRIHIGAGFTWAGDGLGVKFRTAVRLQGDNDQFLNANVMPYFKLGPGTLMVDFGISTQLASDTNNFGWYTTPMYRMPVSSGTVAVGFQLFSNITMEGNINLTGNTDVRLRIPVLLRFGF